MHRFALAIALGLAGWTAAAAEPEQVSVTVGTRPLSEVPWMGFGIQWSPYPWFELTDDDWTRVEERLAFMKPPLARVMTRAYKYCEGYDAAGTPIYAWDNPRMKRMERLLDFCERHGVEVIEVIVRSEMRIVSPPTSTMSTMPKVRWRTRWPAEKATTGAATGTGSPAPPASGSPNAAPTCRT